MEGVAPHFLIPKWGDGSVDGLLQQSGFSFDRVPFGYLGRSRPLWSAITIAQMPLLQWRILRAYRDKGCKTLVVLNTQAVINAPLALWILKHFFRADIVLYLGDIPAKTWLHRQVAHVANQLARDAIVISEAVKRELAAVGFAPERIHVVHNGLDLEDFMNVVPIDFRVRFGWPEESPLIGFVGQFREAKGVWDFLKAAKITVGHWDSARFLLVGPRDLNPRLEHALTAFIGDHGLTDHIAFTGRIEAMAGAYAALDVLVAPPVIEEALGNVVMEAMASGTPVIGTWSGGIPEMIREGETGFLVRKKDPEAIAERILDLLKDPELRAKMGTAARERAAEAFDIKKNVRKVEQLLFSEDEGTPVDFLI